MTDATSVLSPRRALRTRRRQTPMGESDDRLPISAVQNGYDLFPILQQSRAEQVPAVKRIMTFEISSYFRVGPTEHVRRVFEALQGIRQLDDAGHEPSQTKLFSADARLAVYKGCQTGDQQRRFTLGCVAPQRELELSRQPPLGIEVFGSESSWADSPDA